MQRLQKVLAAAGVGSRRQCDELIAQGRVTVDGQLAVPGLQVDAEHAVIHVDGERIPTNSDIEVLAFNKPVGVLSAMRDDRGSANLGDYFRDHPVRLFHVGRLDNDTEGLLLLTNDGELANRIAHPSHGVRKTYVATVQGRVTDGLRSRMRKPIELEDGPVSVDRVRIIAAGDRTSVLELVIHEGRNRIVRRLLAEVGYPVVGLVRTQVGPVRLAGLHPGQHRPLSAGELRALYTLVGL